jgi:hypothetical protein
MTPVTMTPSQSVVDGRWAGKPNKEKRKDISEITMSNDPPMSFATDTRKSNVKSRVPTMCLSGASELRIPRLDLTQTHRSPINAGLTGLTSFFFFFLKYPLIFSLLTVSNFHHTQPQRVDTLRLMASRGRYIPELIYALAFSSISVNLLWQRRAAETDRRHYSARLSILGELAGRLLRADGGEVAGDAEVARLRRLAETVGEDDTHAGESIGWRDVIFGRKESGLEREGKEELERRELERGASCPHLRGVFASPVGLPFCAASSST